MKKNPKVTIIIPVYNGANYVKEAIESALNQTYKNIEIIVVNDGSNDNGKTKKVVSKYLDKIQYYEKENGGVSTALNLALEKMTGDYFSWLSHDDRYYNNKVETQIKYLENCNENTILYSDYDLMDENSNIFAVSTMNHEELSVKKEYALLRGAINGITLLIPKKAFEDIGTFREDLRCTQDYELWLRMMDKYEFVHQPLVLATTRLHQMQTGNTSPRVLSEGKELWIDIIENFSDSKKIELDQSIYLYYKNSLEFMKTTPYTDVVEYLEGKLKSIEKEILLQTEKKKVSIILNAIEASDECISNSIESILNQTHKTWEIITLGNKISRNIYKSKNIQDKIQNIDIDDKDNIHLSLNKSIEQVNGEYIAFLNAGDEFLPDKLTNQLYNMIKDNSDLCFTSYYTSTPVEKEIDINYISQYLVSYSTIMIKKDLIEKNKIKYKKGMKNIVSNMFYLDLLKKSILTTLAKPLTKIYEQESINNENEIETIKEVIKYILNDSEYSKNNKEIAKMFYQYNLLVNPSFTVKTSTSAENNEITIFDEFNEKKEIKNSELIQENRIKRYLRVLKNKGIIHCLKRLIAKLKSKLKR